MSSTLTHMRCIQWNNDTFIGKWRRSFVLVHAKFANFNQQDSFYQADVSRSFGSDQIKTSSTIERNPPMIAKPAKSFEILFICSHAILYVKLSRVYVYQFNNFKWIKFKNFFIFGIRIENQCNESSAPKNVDSRSLVRSPISHFPFTMYYYVWL